MLTVITLVFSGSVMAKPSQDYAPNSKYSKVKKDDIESFKRYSQQHSNEILLIADQRKVKEIGNRLKKNQEFNLFNKKSNEIQNITPKVVFAGKSQNSTNVYLVSYEVSQNYAVVATYDFDRDLLLDAFIVDATNIDKTTITSRNVGLLVQAELGDLAALKEGSESNREKFMKKYYKYNKKDDKEKESNIIGTLFSIESVGAAGPCGVIDSGTTCSWIAVPVCAAFGLVGFLPGLICSASYTLICSNCSP